MFDTNMSTRVLFGYSPASNSESASVQNDKKFVQHAVGLIQMMDTAIAMLGPDIELLTDMLEDLGKKHASYGIATDLFATLGEALIFTLDQLIGKHMDNDTREAWKVTFKAMTTDMLRGYA
jgi:hemoglobin-like flavoprotein